MYYSVSEPAADISLNTEWDEQKMGGLTGLLGIYTRLNDSRNQGNVSTFWRDLPVSGPQDDNCSSIASAR